MGAFLFGAGLETGVGRPLSRRLDEAVPRRHPLMEARGRLGDTQRGVEEGGAIRRRRRCRRSRVRRVDDVFRSRGAAVWWHRRVVRGRAARLLRLGLERTAPNRSNKALWCEVSAAGLHAPNDSWSIHLACQHAGSAGRTQPSVPSWWPLRPLYPPSHPECGCRAVDATFPRKKRGSGQNAGSVM
jgi:hypothetical protein